MAAKQRNTERVRLTIWWKRYWKNTVAAFTALSIVFGAGFAIGKFSESLDSKIEKIKLIQEYNEKINKEVDNCRDLKIQNEKRAADDLEKMIIEFKKVNHEK